MCIAQCLAERISASSLPSAVMRHPVFNPILSKEISFSSSKYAHAATVHLVIRTPSLPRLHLSVHPLAEILVLLHPHFMLFSDLLLDTEANAGVDWLNDVRCVAWKKVKPWCSPWSCRPAQLHPCLAYQGCPRTGMLLSPSSTKSGKHSCAYHKLNGSSGPCLRLKLHLDPIVPGIFLLLCDSASSCPLKINTGYGCPISESSVKRTHNCKVASRLSSPFLEPRIHTWLLPFSVYVCWFAS